METFQFLDSGRANEGGGAPAAPRSAPAAAVAAAPAAEPADADAPPHEGDDVPF
jgi:hypothetical protein